MSLLEVLWVWNSCYLLIDSCLGERGCFGLCFRREACNDYFPLPVTHLLVLDFTCSYTKSALTLPSWPQNLDSTLSSLGSNLGHFFDLTVFSKLLQLISIMHGWLFLKFNSVIFTNHSWWALMPSPAETTVQARPGHCHVRGRAPRRSVWQKDRNLLRSKSEWKSTCSHNPAFPTLLSDFCLHSLL